MSNFITTHSPSGTAIFSASVPETQHPIPIRIGTLSVLAMTHSFPLNLSSEEDLERYIYDRTHNFPKGTICPPGGTAVLLMAMKPGAGSGTESPMHRTQTLDVVVMLDGAVEIELDSKEKRVLKKGDSLVQRGTMHRWRNVTEDGDGWARFIVLCQGSAGPLSIGGKVLGVDCALSEENKIGRVQKLCKLEAYS